MKIVRPERKFVDANLSIDSWEAIEGYYENLVNRDLTTAEDFKQWLKDQSELEAILEEDAAWRYIKMTIDTRDEDLSKSYTFFVSEIQPKLAPFEDQLNKKLVESEFTKDLESNSNFFILWYYCICFFTIKKLFIS